MSKIRAVLFDLDGVLIDACEIHYIALNCALKNCGYQSISREEHIATYNGLPTTKKLQILLNEHRIDEAAMPTIESTKQLFTVDAIENSIFPDEAVLELLDKLCHKKLACVTNCITKTAVLMLEKAEILSRLDTVVTNEDVLNPKPHPEPYLQAMGKLGCAPGECTIVEDSPKGVESAKKSGGNVVVVEGPHEVNADLYYKLI
ncbi:MAG: HAD family hydrolase [Candidatus Thorarchaeota archaeon]|jgi:HAD superfamily hydrolase (TIGR01509 family)